MSTGRGRWCVLDFGLDMTGDMERFWRTYDKLRKHGLTGDLGAGLLSSAVDLMPETTDE